MNADCARAFEIILGSVSTLALLTGLLATPTPTIGTTAFTGSISPRLSAHYHTFYSAFRGY